MFYKKNSFEEESPSKEFYLLNNYLDKLPFSLNEIASRKDFICIDEIGNMRSCFSVSQIRNKTFRLIVKTRRNLRIECLEGLIPFLTDGCIFKFVRQKAYLQFYSGSNKGLCNNGSSKLNIGL
jgi:hypothetical protein